MEKTKVLIAIPYVKDICIGLTKFLSSIEGKDKYEVEVFPLREIPIDSSRNRMVKHFLKSNNDYLLMIDDDITPPSDILKMTEHGKDIISALCFVIQNGVPYPLLMRKEEEKGYKILTGEGIDTVTRVGGVGTGCLMMSRKALETIKAPWFLFPRDEYGIMSLGEDYYFSRKAEEAGFELFVDITKQCGHTKDIDLKALSVRFTELMTKKIGGEKKDDTTKV